VEFGGRQDILMLTPEWTGDRFDDGRPRVSDDVIERLKVVSTEEAWAVLWGKGYEFQFEGGWKQLNPGKVLVGRAVTATFVPRRPDLHDCLMEHGHSKEGRIGEMNSWVIETLVEGDVVVVDLFGKVFKGTFSGGNLSTTIATRTKRGQIIDGGIRDAQQILTIDNLVTFCRGMDPTPIRDVTLAGLNGIVRIGNATCLPGDIVLATYTGVLFIPPQFAEEVVEHSERTRLREFYGLQRLREGVYTSAQMDTKWTDEIEADFDLWRQSHTPEEFAHLDWSKKTTAEDARDDEETLI
jgi:regulator of RNase E activity RraA